MTSQNSFTALDNLVGRQEVKQGIHEFVNKIKQQKQMKIAPNAADWNLAFLGNPGTGKSMVAGILGNILKETGVLSGGQVVTVTRADLVDNHIGASYHKTAQAVEKALGGILFIDESNLLRNGETDLFGQEVVDTLVPLMNNRAGDFICIFSGNPEATLKFLDSNPALKARVGKIMLFEDFTPSEMMEVFKRMKGILSIDPEAEQLLMQKFIRLYEERGSNFGNAHTLRNMLNEIQERLNSRALTSEFSDNNINMEGMLERMFSGFRITKDDII